VLNIRVLGAAAGGGFPQWNANSEACRRARRGDKAAPPATQASIAVSGDGERWFVINASPDLRHQIEANPCLHPRERIRSSPLAGVVVTNADVDAIAGLLHLREGTPFSLYGPGQVLAILEQNPIFDVLDRRIVPRRELQSDQWQPLLTAGDEPSGLEVRPFRLPGKLPLYLEGEMDAAAIPADTGGTLGLEIKAGDARFIYAANCAAVTDEVASRLSQAPLVFFDGTLLSDDEMIRQGVGAKTGRRMGHVSLSGPDGSLARLAPLGIGRRIYIHINNTNPILLKDSPERREVESAGFEIAYDGMEITL
jgi:pyrroloquinoline quinone biosynthesis protein B